MHKIKLLTLINNMSEGGAQHMVYELLKKMNSDEYELYLICYEKEQGTNLERLVGNVAHVVYLGIDGKIGFTEFSKVFKEIKKIKPDIIHAHQGGVTFAIPWSLFFKVPLVITVHTKPERAFSKKNRTLINYRAVFSKFALVAVSKENYYLVKDYFKVDQSQIYYINNGIDADKYYKSLHKNFTFINVARQDKNKNQETIIKCFSKLKNNYDDISLILVGEGPETINLKSLTDELKLNEYVNFTGIVSNPEQYYSISDVYIQSSHREAMPLSVLEAMAAGLPIISTNVGGLKDVVNNNGLLINDSEEALEVAMKQMLEMDSERIIEMSNESLQIVKAYSSDKMAFNYSEIYRKLLANKKGVFN